MKVNIGPYVDEGDRQVDIHIDNYDTWGMDCTLALIILPMLKQLKETNHGAPRVDDCDVPESLRSTSAGPKENNWDTDEFYFDRWNYVMDEMIWAFEQIVKDDTDQFFSGDADFKFEDNNDGTSKLVKGPNHTYKMDKEAFDIYHNRISRGTTFFGKYYRGLWD